MKNWTPEGHLTDVALELRAAGEAEAPELRLSDSHLAACPACRAGAADWSRLIRALQSLPPLDPCASFDDQVMARVRVAVQAKPAAAWLPKLARKLRPVALGAAAVWSAAVIGGGLWLGGRIELPAAAFVAGGLTFIKQLLWAGVLRLGAFLHLSGLIDLWADVVEAVPGPGVLSAVAVMTAVSGLAIWTLHKVVRYEPSGVDAHV